MNLYAVMCHEEGVSDQLVIDINQKKRKKFIHWSVKPRGLARGYKRLA